MKPTKKQIIQQQAAQLQELSFNYKTWEEDFGFLNLIIARTTNTHNLFFIQTYSAQLENNMMIRDEDIEESHSKLVLEVINSLSESYVNFLSTKYFKNKEALYSFISDSIYIDILKNANNANKAKITKIRSNQLSEEVWSLNNLKKDE